MNPAAPASRILCLVLDGGVPLDRVEAALAGGVDWLQLRDRSLDARPLHERAIALRALADASGRRIRLIVNRRLDVAWAAGADGVHLGYDALPPAAARSLLERHAKRDWEVGVSAHSAAEVEAAREAGATYAHLAPIFPPISKAAERPALGLDPLRRACESGLPVFAQGGIEAKHVAEVLASGVAGVSVTGAILGKTDAEAAARTLRDALDAGAASGQAERTERG